MIKELYQKLDYWIRGLIPVVGLMGVGVKAVDPKPVNNDEGPRPTIDNPSPSHRDHLLITPKGKDLFYVNSKWACRIQRWQHKYSEWSHQVLWNSIREKNQRAQQELERKFIW